MIQASNAFSRFIFDLFLIRFTYLIMKYFLLFLFIFIHLCAEEKLNFKISFGKYGEFIDEIEAVYVMHWWRIEKIYNYIHELDVIVYDILELKISLTNPRVFRQLTRRFRN